MTDSDTAIRIEFEYIALHAFLWHHVLPAEASGMMLGTDRLGLAQKESRYSTRILDEYDQAIRFMRDTSQDAINVMINVAQVLDEILLWRKSSQEYLDALDRTARR